MASTRAWSRGRLSIGLFRGTIERLLCDATVVTHTHFDRVAMHQAAHRCAIEPTTLPLARFRENSSPYLGGLREERIWARGCSLFDEVVIFTVALEIPRREAADLAAAVGCDVAPSVTKETTLLIVGDIDVKRLAGHEKSSKHRKAEELIAKGFLIRIIRETDFRELVSIL